MLEATMLAYKQKVKILQIPPNQLLIFMIKASFVPKFQALTTSSTVFTCICRLCTFRMGPRVLYMYWDLRKRLNESFSQNYESQPIMLTIFYFYMTQINFGALICRNLSKVYRDIAVCK